MVGCQAFSITETVGNIDYWHGESLNYLGEH